MILLEMSFLLMCHILIKVVLFYPHDIMLIIIAISIISKFDNKWHYNDNISKHLPNLLQ